MTILVDRRISDGRSTLSQISVDGVHVCFGLEDEARTLKVKGETRIPAGTYKVALRTEGSHHERYKDKFDFHKGMLHILDVPNFQYILIHIGNDEDDTEGCLLVGMQAQLTYHSIRLIGSTLAYVSLYRRVVDEAGKSLEIRFEDNDPQT